MNVSYNRPWSSIPLDFSRNLATPALRQKKTKQETFAVIPSEKKIVQSRQSAARVIRTYGKP